MGVCLCMIVRDEVAVVDRCIESALPLIDSWLIIDTGSSDATQQVAQMTLHGVPGRMLEREWVNFGHNRTELLREASISHDLLLVLDADMTVEGEIPDTLDGDAFYVPVSDGSLDYRLPLLLRNRGDWAYEGAAHEYLKVPGDCTQVNLDALRVTHHADGGSREDKLHRDALLLEPDARSIFYLAQTHRDLGNAERALRLYRERVEMGGWDEEVFYAQLQVGRLLAQLGREAEAIDALITASDLRPSRAEPLYELAGLLRKARHDELAHEYARKAVSLPQPDDRLFVEREVYRWGALFELSITAYWVGERDSALAACDQLLEMDLPPEIREQVQQNRTFCLPKGLDMPTSSSHA